MKTINQNLGWCRLPFEVLQDNALTVTDAVVYAVLLDSCAYEFECVCKISDICVLTGISDSSVKRAILHLEQCGYIEHERTGKESVYHLADIIGLKRGGTAPRKKAAPMPEEPEWGQQEIKLKYGQFQNVELTLEQFDKLVSDFGEAKALEYIRKCDEYAHEHGRHYSDCEFTIRKWIAEDANKKSIGKAVKQITPEREAELDLYLDFIN